MLRKVRLWAYHVALYWAVWRYARLQLVQLRLLEKATKHAQRVTAYKLRCIEEELKQG
jgi:hypothetical protein